MRSTLTSRHQYIHCVYLLACPFTGDYCSVIRACDSCCVPSRLYMSFENPAQISALYLYTPSLSTSLPSKANYVFIQCKKREGGMATAEGIDQVRGEQEEYERDKTFRCVVDHFRVGELVVHHIRACVSHRSTVRDNNTWIWYATPGKENGEIAVKELSSNFVRASDIKIQMRLNIVFPVRA